MSKRPTSPFFFPRFRVRTLTAVTAVVAVLLGLLVYCDRAFQAYRAAISHADSAEGYRWLQGLESDFGSWPWARFPESGIWSPRELDFLRGMECYHRDMSHHCRAAIYRPWRASPSERPRPQLPEDEHSSTLATLSPLFAERPSTLATLSSLFSEGPSALATLSWLFSERIHSPDLEARAVLITWLDETERARPILEEGLRRNGQRAEAESFVRELDRLVDAGRRQLKNLSPGRR